MIKHTRGALRATMVSSIKAGLRSCVMGFAVLSVAAAGGFSPKPAAADPAPNIVVGDTFLFARGLGPPNIGTLFSFRVVQAVYDGLTGWDGPGITAGDDPKPIPDLASDWTVSDDGLVYTFSLRPDVLFSTGRPLNAEAVKASFERAIQVLDNVGLAAQFPWTKWITDIVVEDELSIRFEFSQPYAAFAAAIAGGYFAIVDVEEAYAHEVDGDLGAEWLSVNSAGSGPYMFSADQYVAEQRMVLAANPHYWGGFDDIPAGADRIVLVHIPENATRQLMVAGGELDVALGLDPVALDSLRSDDRLSIEMFPSTLTCNFLPDLRMEPLAAKHPLVLQALRYGIDYQGFIDVVAGGVGLVQQTMFLPGMIGYEESTATYYDYDPEKSRELLAEAGFPDGFDITLRARDGSCGTVSYPKAMEWYQQQLAKIGINAQIIHTTGGDFWGTVFDGDGKMRDVGISGLGAVYFDPDDPANVRAIQHGRQFGWEAVDPEAYARAQELTELGQTEMNSEKRHEIYAELALLMVERAPQLTIMLAIDPVVLGPGVTGGVTAPGHFPIDYKYLTK